MNALTKIEFSPTEEVINNAIEIEAAKYGINPRIDLLARVMRGVTEQKYYTVPLTDFFTVNIGGGGGEENWDMQLLKFTKYTSGDDTIESGIISTAENSSRLSEVTATFGTKSFRIWDWVKLTNYSLHQLKTAMAAGNFDFIEEQEKSRYLNWKLGMQRMAFLGSDKIATAGLVVSGTFIDNTLFPAGSSLSTMNAATFNTVVAGLIPRFCAQVSYTSMPDRFVIPMDDYIKLAATVSPDFPILSRIQHLENVLRAQTGNPNFRVLGLPYCMTQYSGLAKPRYILYNGDANTMSFEIIINYNNIMGNSITNGGLHFTSAAYSRFAGLCVYREQEILYFEPANA